MTSLLAIDISHHQKTTPSLALLGSVIVKATEGSGHVDELYTTHASHVLGQGKYLASYHFALSTADIEAQALLYLGHTARAAALAIDNENKYANINGVRTLVSRRLNRTDTNRLIAAVKAHDSLRRECGLYMAEYDYLTGGYAACNQDFNWIAKWGSTPPRTPWDIWQYSGDPLDHDRFVSQGVLDRIFRVPPDSSTSPTAPHFNAVVTTATNLWNPATGRWVFNRRNVIKVGTRLVIRGAQYRRGGVLCYPIVGPPYAGYWVPVAHVRVGTKVP